MVRGSPAEAYGPMDGLASAMANLGGPQDAGMGGQSAYDPHASQMQGQYPAGAVMTTFNGGHALVDNPHDDVEVVWQCGCLDTWPGLLWPCLWCICWCGEHAMALLVQIRPSFNRRPKQLADDLSILRCGMPQLRQRLSDDPLPP